MDANDFRELALCFDDAEEDAHTGPPTSASAVASSRPSPMSISGSGT
jgi:hypothetical protein